MATVLRSLVRSRVALPQRRNLGQAVDLSKLDPKSLEFKIRSKYPHDHQV